MVVNNNYFQLFQLTPNQQTCPAQLLALEIIRAWQRILRYCYILLQVLLQMKHQPQIAKEKRLVKILAISDTHYQHEKIDISSWPQADIFIHAGDFTITSTRQELHNFRQFLGKLPYKYKIVVAGNHDFGLEPQVEMYHELCARWQVPKNEWVNPQEEIKKLQSMCTYLCHDFVEVEGVKIFGTPHVWVAYDHAFKTANMTNQQVWSKLPPKIDVLVTHMPPFGILDSTAIQHTGCKRLLASVNKIQPKLHIFGHIHESHGMSAIGSTSFYNVSALDEHYNPKHGPTLINLWV